MAICTFFGHSDCPDNIFKEVKETITDLYQNHDVTEYYVGNHGNFDSIVTRALKEIRQNYPNINFSVVLAEKNNKTVIKL